jgi:membrane fusion protein (multidrug efflux system)
VSVRRRWPDLALVAALAIAGCAGCSGSAPSAKSGPAASAPLAVHVVAARGRTVDRSIDLTGSLLAENEATIAAEVEGRVTEVRVDLGSRVAQGDVLARLDRDMLAASLRQAEARLRSASVDEERARKLSAEGVVSPQEYGRLATVLEVARAERDLARIRLEHSTVTAPTAGAVTARLVDAGDYARIGSPLFTIVADRVLRLRGEVPERFVPELALGLDMRGDVDAVPGLTVRGRVARLNAALDPKNRTLTIEAEIDNRDGALKPGYFVRGSILTQRGVETVSVPASAVFSFAGVAHVYVMSEGQARTREVELGQRLEDDVEILSGLRAGEPVITSGLARLYEGAPVEPSRDAAGAAATAAGAAS